MIERLPLHLTSDCDSGRFFLDDIWYKQAGLERTPAFNLPKLLQEQWKLTLPRKHTVKKKKNYVKKIYLFEFMFCNIRRSQTKKEENHKLTDI